MDDNDADYGRGRLEIRVHGRLTSLALLRTLVGAHAAAAGFDPDAVADLKLAVDEACTALIVRLGPEGADLDLVITRADDEFAVEISSAGVQVDDVLEGFTGHVLNILADDVKTFRVSAGDGRPAASGLSMVVRPNTVG
jgi:serine/threonine-protein kinase RsbW